LPRRSGASGAGVLATELARRGAAMAKWLPPGLRGWLPCLALAWRPGAGDERPFWP